MKQFCRAPTRLGRRPGFLFAALGTLLANGCSPAADLYLEVSAEEFETYVEWSSSHSGLTEGTSVVPDAATAAAIAFALVETHYGRATAVLERPYRVANLGSRWLVRGTLPQDFDGGVVSLEIRRRDGLVLHFSHGE